jgi:hypothetical protein
MPCNIWLRVNASSARNYKFFDDWLWSAADRDKWAIIVVEGDVCQVFDIIYKDDRLHICIPFKDSFKDVGIIEALGGIHKLDKRDFSLNDARWRLSKYQYLVRESVGYDTKSINSYMSLVAGALVELGYVNTMEIVKDCVVKEYEKNKMTVCVDIASLNVNNVDGKDKKGGLFGFSALYAYWFGGKTL